MDDNIIYVDVKENSLAKLTFPKYNIETIASIGENGASEIMIEGNKKTPLGLFEFGIAMGTHSETEMKNKLKINYTQINKNMYWVDDINSKYYNQLVDITKTPDGWNSAEHLIDFPDEYEYLIEIKCNPNNIPNKGSAIFFHCNDNGKPTLGCIGIKRKEMETILPLIDENTKILIRK